MRSIRGLVVSGVFTRARSDERAVRAAATFFIFLHPRAFACLLAPRATPLRFGVSQRGLRHRRALPRMDSAPPSL